MVREFEIYQVLGREVSKGVSKWTERRKWWVREDKALGMKQGKENKARKEV